MMRGRLLEISRARHCWQASVLAVGVLATGMISGAPVQAQGAVSAATAGMEEFEGKLADGTPYVLRKPANWNGIVLRDLDGQTNKDGAVHLLLLKSGYGLAGVTRRSHDRAWTLNRWDDMQRPQQAVELFKAKFGKPKYVFAFGRSAGGSSTILTSERHPETVDGGVALCATFDIIGYAGYNTIFDYFYILKALLAPNDASLLTHGLPTADPEPYQQRWAKLLESSSKTPEGRARIALAYTLVQYAAFGSNRGEKGVLKPNFNDAKAVADAMVQGLPHFVTRLGLLTVHEAKDFPPDLAIPGTPVSNPVGNDGAVYADYWKGADPVYKRAVETLYADAKLNLATDLRTIDAYPRVSLDRDNMRHGVLARGLPTVPVFTMDNLGDQTAPPSISSLYGRLVALNGLGDLYRNTNVDNSGHCFFKPQQVLAAVDVMRERLETGKWPATDAAALNARAGVNDGDGVVFVDHRPVAHASTWRLESHTDLFQPATYAKATALVNGYRYSVTTAQRERLLADLSAAERAPSRAEANAALNRFAETANGVSNRIVRTRLLVTARHLRRGD